MSRKSKPLKVVVANPPSKEHANELINQINEKFKRLYDSNYRNEKHKTTKRNEVLYEKN